MIRKKILILCYNHLRSDPRVQRQILALKKDFTIEVCAYSDSGHDDIMFHEIYKTPEFSILRKLKRASQFYFRFYDSFYWDTYKLQLKELLSARSYDIIIANDIQTLPLALGIAAKQGKVYFDSHDYHPREFDADLLWRIFNKPYIKHLCKKYIPLAASLLIAATCLLRLSLTFSLNFSGSSAIILFDSSKVNPTG